MSDVASLAEFDATLTSELNTLWLMIGAILVFFMQTGFAMLEVGSVDSKNTRNILLKNVLDASLGAVVWYTIGYGLAQGKSPTGIYGTDSFFLTTDKFSDGTGNGYGAWFFQWAFAATAATIVSGAVAERVTFTAYVTYALCLVGFIYPVVVQVAWGADGYMSPWVTGDSKSDFFRGCGVLDFAGSGVVHMTGGVAALVGAAMLGPRQGIVDGTHKVPTYGPIFQTLGTLILWFGWYGFNAGSTLAIVGYGEVAAKTMVTTTLSAACGALGTLVFGSFFASSSAGKTVIKLDHANNGVLAGLVGITASCSVVEPWAACLIGTGSSLVYLGSSAGLKKCGVDDVVDACPVHGFCGAFGVFCAGLFASPHNYKAAYGIYDGAEDYCGGLFYTGNFNQLSANLAFIVFVVAWVGVTSAVVFGLLFVCSSLRTSPEVEEEGMDSSEHGAPHRN